MVNQQPVTSIHPSRVPLLRPGFALWRAARRVFSRRNLTIRILGLSVCEGTANESGLILLQIDGLAYPQLEKAIRDGRLPFIRRLVRREHYRAFPMYSGQPATTPAVLAELFYGVSQAVPAYSFRDHRSGRVVEMIEPEIASMIQSELEAAAPGLLQDGSAYCDIYSGGAVESQFCPANMTWSAMADAKAWQKAAIALLNVPALLRLCVDLVAEFGAATWDVVSSRLGRREIKHELKFIPRRMIGSVLIRELTAIAAEVDATRGLPVMHVNLLGYDELAHRRGPDSDYAHKGLPEIDRVLQRLWQAAMSSRRRDYHVWIMADHGQERTVPYDQLHGRTIIDGIRELFGDSVSADDSNPQTSEGTGAEQESGGPIVTAIGPLGYLYWPTPLTAAQIEERSHRIAVDLKVPVVMARSIDGPIAWFEGRRLKLPHEAGEFLGADHPFLREVSKDFARLCDHPDAGQIVICGYQRNGTSVSFVAEHGAHGGPGPQETNGFVLVPPEDRRLVPELLRPNALRRAALSLLQSPQPRQSSSTSVVSARRDLRLVTYNVHSCIGLDGRLSPRRIARLLAALEPDVVALQELDVGRQRSGGVDQARVIADELSMDCQFHPCLELASEKYGNAVLSRLPMQIVQAGKLPHVMRGAEPRGALWVRIDCDCQTLNLITTHFGLHPRDRDRQIEAILGPDWLARLDSGAPVIVCGDLNAGPKSSVYRQLSRVLRDAYVHGGIAPQRTWYSPFPLARLDYVFVSGDISVTEIRTSDTHIAQVASDHLPVVADLVLPEPKSATCRSSAAPVRS
jgi:endonuclease/exonuclease/phosphatase family metal-dependent hydrolase